MSREIKAVCVVAKPPRHNPQSGGVLVPVRFRYKVRDYTKGCEYHATDRGTEHVLVSGDLVPVIYPLRPGDVFGVAGGVGRHSEAATLRYCYSRARGHTQ